MNEYWVLSVKTSLPHICRNCKSLNTDFSIFGNFEDGEKALRAKLKDLAFSENKMFDGAGKITYFEEYFSKIADSDYEDEYEDEEYLTKSIFCKISEKLTDIFKGKGTDISDLGSYYSDFMIAAETDHGVLSIYGVDDGPCNGYDPQIYTNMFDMSKEDDYFLYIDDLFGQDEYSSVLYIDLKKVCTQ